MLPVWRASYLLDGETYQVVISGQDGTVTGERPTGGVGGFLRRLFGAAR
jgi:hypothetical protein